MDGSEMLFWGLKKPQQNVNTITLLGWLVSERKLK